MFGLRQWEPKIVVASPRPATVYTAKVQQQPGPAWLDLAQPAVIAIFAIAVALLLTLVLRRGMAQSERALLCGSALAFVLLVIALAAWNPSSLVVLSVGGIGVALIVGQTVFSHRAGAQTNDGLNTIQETVDKHGAVLDAVTRHDIRRRTRALARRIDKLIAPFFAKISKAADAMEADPYVDATSELQQEMDHILEMVASEFIGEIRDLILEYNATLHYNNDLMREIAAMTHKLSESRKDCSVQDVNWLARTLYGLARTVPWQ